MANWDSDFKKHKSQLPFKVFPPTTGKLSLNACLFQNLFISMRVS